MVREGQKIMEGGVGDRLTEGQGRGCRGGGNASDTRCEPRDKTKELHRIIGSSKKILLLYASTFSCMFQ